MALLPTYFLSVGIIGQVSAAGFYQVTLFIITAIDWVFLKVVIVMVKIYLVINLVNNISKEDFLSKSANLVKDFISFINKSMIGLITGINVIQGMILPHVDNAKNTTIRKMAGAIPVIGDGTSAAADILISSAKLIKNSIGTFAIIAIIIICVIPIIKLLLYSISFQVTNAVLQPIADKRITECIATMCESIKILIRIAITVTCLFIITIAIICLSTNLG